MFIHIYANFNEKFTELILRSDKQAELNACWLTAPH